MVFDDSPDKVRRNIVIFSAAIIASAFLKISLTKSTVFFNVLDISNLEPTKTWITVLTIFIYLTYRFHFDEKTTEQRALIRAEIERISIKTLQKNLAKKIVCYLKTRKYSRNLPDLATALERDITALKIEHASAQALINPSNSAIWFVAQENTFKLTFSITTFDKQEKAIQMASSIPYRLVSCTYLYIKLITILKLLTATKTSVNYIAPYLLITVALLIVIYRLTISI